MAKTMFIPGPTQGPDLECGFMFALSGYSDGSVLRATKKCDTDMVFRVKISEAGSKSVNAFEEQCVRIAEDLVRGLFKKHREKLQKERETKPG